MLRAKVIPEQTKIPKAIIKEGINVALCTGKHDLSVGYINVHVRDTAKDIIVKNKITFNEEVL